MVRTRRRGPGRRGRRGRGHRWRGLVVRTRSAWTRPAERRARSAVRARLGWTRPATALARRWLGRRGLGRRVVPASDGSARGDPAASAAARAAARTAAPEQPTGACGRRLGSRLRTAPPDSAADSAVGDAAEGPCAAWGWGCVAEGVRWRGGCGPRPAAAGKPLVHVTMPYTTLLGVDDEPCELAGYGPIPAELAREIAADAVWKRLVTDPLSGALLDHGRKTYRPPVALAEFVRARDVRCRSPICRRQAGNCELDHTVAWVDGGSTAEPNLWAGCVHDHHVKHRPGWSVCQRSDGRIVWTTPTGHCYSSDPHDYRPVGDPDPPLLARSVGRDPVPEQLRSPAESTKSKKARRQPVKRLDSAAMFGQTQSEQSWPHRGG